MARARKENKSDFPSKYWFKTAFEDVWDMWEEFILKPCKPFRRRVDTTIEKKMAAILSKFTVLGLSSYFLVYFFLIRINLVFEESHLLLYENILNFASSPRVDIYIYIYIVISSIIT